MNPDLLVYAYAVLGLIIGSFLNVCIYRIPLGKSVVFPRSGCPRCGKPIQFYDNIPVLSYLLLRGKCRFCKEPISIQYPIVELLTAVAFYSCAKTWYFEPPTFVNSLFLAILIILIFTDNNHRLLPNILTLPGTVAGILLSPFQAPPPGQLSSFYADKLSALTAGAIFPGNPGAALPWVGSILGAIIGGGSLLLVGVGYMKLRNRQGLGMGDVKMMAMVGAFLGYYLAFLTIFIGSLLGLIVGVYLILFRKMNLQTKLAFGVSLGIGAAICLFYGFPLLGWYFRFYR
ncbi:MAG TPA: prepilin peptidase [Acidobacteriota bacterium]|nr:prepilin peptidase [Acidobacteriota bacterium]